MDFKTLVDQILVDNAGVLKAMISGLNLKFTPQTFKRSRILEFCKWSGDTIDTFTAIQFWTAVIMALKLRLKRPSERDITKSHIEAEEGILANLDATPETQLAWIRLYERTTLKYILLLSNDDADESKFADVDEWLTNTVADESLETDDATLEIDDEAQEIEVD